METSDYELVKLCLSGNNSAFEELVSRYKNLVYSTVFRSLNNAEDANDIAQEVFIKTYKNLEKYSPEYKFSTWLIKITTNTVIDFRRRKKIDTVDIEEAVNEPSSMVTPESAYIDKERKDELSRIIDSLPEMYKTPIVLYHVENMNYQEISYALGIPLSKVKNRIFRGRKLLKDMLTENKI